MVTSCRVAAACRADRALQPYASQRPIAPELQPRERDGEVVRNDRVIAVAVESTTHRDLRDLDDISDALLGEIEAFFDQYNRLDGKEFRVLHRRGGSAAAGIVAAARPSAE